MAAIIVFIGIFLICVLTKDVSNKIYYPFALEFVFILTQGGTVDGLLISLLALVASTILIFVINLLYHRNQPVPNKTSSNNSIKEIFCSKFRKDKNHYLFSIELAIILAIFESLSFYFNIPHAKWLSVTALSILQPNINVAIKGMNRIKGTIIGVIIFIIIYLIVVNYFNSYSFIIGLVLLLD